MHRRTFLKYLGVAPLAAVIPAVAAAPMPTTQRLIDNAAIKTRAEACFAQFNEEPKLQAAG